MEGKIINIQRYTLIITTLHFPHPTAPFFDSDRLQSPFSHIRNCLSPSILLAIGFTPLSIYLVIGRRKVGLKNEE